jgi:hypothetical protein
MLCKVTWYRVYQKESAIFQENVCGLIYMHVTKYTYVRSSTVMEIIMQEKCGLLVVPHTVVVLSVHFTGSSLSR